MKIESKVFAAVLVLAFIAFSVPYFMKMHSIYFNLATGLDELPQIYLLERDAKVFGSESTFTVFASGTLACEKCGRAVFLHKGENALSYEGCEGEANVTCSGWQGDKLEVRFKFERPRLEPGGQAPAPWARLDGFSAFASNRTVFISLNGTGESNGEKRLWIYVDGKQAASPLVSFDGDFSFNERIYPVAPGNHNVTVQLLGQEASAEGSVPGEYDWMLPLTLIACLAFLYASKRRALSERLLIFFILLAAAFTLEFRLAWYGLGWLVPVGVLAIFVLEARRAGRGKKQAAGSAVRKARGAGKEEKKLLQHAFLFAAAIAVYILLLTALVGKEDVWGSYYYRQAQETLQRGTSAYFDSLSYLGRNFTYPPGFMEFTAQAANLVGVSDVAGIQVPFNLAVVAFYAFTLFLVFRKWEGTERLLASLLVFSEWANIYTATGITLHFFAYGFLNIAIVFLEEKAVLAGIALALSVLAHPTSALLLPVYSFFAKKFSWDAKWLKQVIVVEALACILAAPFFLPIFLQNGMPNEIVPQKWGYLLSFGLEGIMFDFQFVLVLALLAAAYGLFTGALLPALSILLLFFANAFISFRANLFLVFAIAAGVPLLLRKIMTPSLYALVLAVIIANFLTAPFISSGTKWWCTWGMANDACIDPMRFIAAHEPSESAVALNPYFGHLEAYHGKKAELADLYVEWADYEKWKAENDFYEQRNISSLSAYNISLFVLDDLHEERDLPGMARVYDNGFMHAFERE